LKAANTNRTVGTHCNRAMGQWLRDNGLSDIVAQERYKILLILDNLPAIEAWRAGLSAEKRRRLNHPAAIWMHWRQVGIADGLRERAAGTHNCVIAANGGKPHRSGKAVFWSQDHVKRGGADAMRGSRSNDLYVLAPRLPAGRRQERRRSCGPAQHSRRTRAGLACAGRGGRARIGAQPRWPLSTDD
jgi:hypothetical protein